MQCQKCTNPTAFQQTLCNYCLKRSHRPSNFMVELPVVKERKEGLKNEDLFDRDFVLAAGDISVTSQGNKIVLTKREGKVYTKLAEIDIEQAFALGIAIRSVATCLKYGKGE